MELKWYDVLNALSNGDFFSREEIAATAVEAKACIQELQEGSKATAFILTLEEALVRGGVKIPKEWPFQAWLTGEETPQITRLFKRVSETVYESLGTTWGCHLHLTSDQLTIIAYFYNMPPDDDVPILDREDPRTIAWRSQTSTTMRTVTGFNPDDWTAEDFDRFEKKCLAEFLNRQSD